MRCFGVLWSVTTQWDLGVNVDYGLFSQQGDINLILFASSAGTVSQNQSINWDISTHKALKINF